jgi:hypothetical protein
MLFEFFEITQLQPNQVGMFKANARPTPTLSSILHVIKML